MPTSANSDLNLYLRLLSYVRAYWRAFSIAILAMILLAAVMPALAALLKHITAGVFLEQEARLVRVIILPVLALFTIAGIASYISEFAMLWVANRVVMDLRIAMFERLLALSSAALDGFEPGRLISKFTFDVAQLKDAATSALTTAVKDSLSIIGLLAWMLYLDAAMTLVIMLTSPLIALVLIIIRRRLRRLGLGVQESMGGIHHALDESIGGHRLIKVYGGRQQELTRFVRQVNQNRLQGMKFSIAAAAGSPIIQLIIAFALAAIIYIAAAQAAAGGMRVDTFNSFFAALLLILGPIKRLARINEHMQRGLAACESIFALIDQPAEGDAPLAGLASPSMPSSSPSNVRGRLQYRRVSFRYAGRAAPALVDISLEVEPGMTIALVGPSGGGKSTLVNLLPRFYHHTGGEILLDGIDIRTLPLDRLRGALAYVGQDIMLLSDTIRGNIAYGGTADADDERIIEAARQANALAFIQALPQGLDTPVGNRGARLSGGQQQRIALARAFLKGAPILILDEATSALDTESERLIQQSIGRMDCTCLIIAHRLSTIEAADHIFVLDAGRIVEAGTHQGLLAGGGVYARLQQLASDATSCL